MKLFMFDSKILNHLDENKQMINNEHYLCLNIWNHLTVYKQ